MATDNHSCLTNLLAVGWCLTVPLYWSVNTLASLFTPTSGERARRAQLPCYERPFLLSIAVPALIVIVTLTFPLALVGLCFWIPVRLCKPRYLLAISNVTKPREININALSHEQFGIVTCNVRLLPEAVARRHNLADTHARARHVGSNVAFSHLPSESSSGCSCDAVDHGTALHLTAIPRPCHPTTTTLPHSSASSNYEIWPSLIREREFNDIVSKSVDGTDKSNADCVITIHNGRQIANVENSRSSSLHEVTVAVNDRDGDSDVEQTSGKVSLNINANKQEKATNSDAQPQIMLHLETDVPKPVVTQNTHYESNPTQRGDNPLDKHSLRNSTSSYRSRDSSCFLSFHEDVFEYFLSDVFPSESEFLCLQDIGDPSAMKTIVSQLQGYFPYILYDIGKPSCMSDFFFGSSGIVFASHFPIENVEFRNFSDSFHRFSCLSKGILMIKVRLKEQGSLTKGIMGYISIANLEPHEGACHIRKSQLNEIQTWLAEFRQMSAPEQGCEDIVAFDLLCGDFNFDNESQRDEECWSHSLMTHYQDPCRICQGKDKLWTIGTRLIKSQLHNPDVHNPVGLKQTLSDVTRRGEFIESIDFKAHHPDKQNANNGKRRTDYILYNLETGDTNLCVDEYHFSTQMASLTDHLAVAMRFHLEERK